jgi:hypothetical protein
VNGFWAASPARALCIAKGSVAFASKQKFTVGHVIIACSCCAADPQSRRATTKTEANWAAVQNRNQLAAVIGFVARNEGGDK